MKITIKYVGNANIQTSMGILSKGATFDVEPGHVNHWVKMKSANGSTLFELLEVEVKEEQKKPKRQSKRSKVEMIIEEDGE